MNSAVRYALGRMTYVGSATVDYILQVLPLIDNRTIECFINDLKHYDENVKKGICDWGMDCDKEIWFDFKKLCKAELQKRESSHIQGGE